MCWQHKQEHEGYRDQPAWLPCRTRGVNAPRPLWSEIMRVRREIQDALWAGDADRAAALYRELERLEMLQSYGETHDVDH